MTVSRSDYSLIKRYKLVKSEDGSLQEEFSGYDVYGPDGEYLGFAEDLTAADIIITDDMEKRELSQGSAPGM